MHNFNLFAIDMGSSFTKICSHDKGMVYHGDSFVAKNSKGEYLETADIDRIASMMHPAYTLTRPVVCGEITDVETAQAHLAVIFNSLRDNFSKNASKAVMCVKKNITEMQKTAFYEAARGVNIKDVSFVDSIIASAVGAGFDISGYEARLVVDIGADKTEAAVIAFSDCVTYECINVGGNTMSTVIAENIIKNYGIEIGKGIAGGLKKINIENDVAVSGKNCVTGIPASAVISKKDIGSSLELCFEKIAECIRSLIAKTPPELMVDIMKNGIVLTGGGAYTQGLCSYISDHVGIDALVSDNSSDAACLGAVIIARNLDPEKENYKRRVSA